MKPLVIKERNVKKKDLQQIGQMLTFVKFLRQVHECLLCYFFYMFEILKLKD